MLYVAIFVGFCLTMLMLGLCMAAKRGDDRLEAYHREHWKAQGRLEEFERELEKAKRVDS